MKFEVYCGDGSKRTFDSADEVSDFRNYHKDDCGGIERICVESDSGDHSDWTYKTNDFTWERSKQGEYSRYDHSSDDSSSDSDPSPHHASSTSGEPVAAWEVYATLLVTFFILVAISVGSPLPLNKLFSFAASVVLLILVIKAAVDIVSWIFDP